MIKLKLLNEETSSCLLVTLTDIDRARELGNKLNSCFKFQWLLLKMYVEYIRNVKSSSKNVQVQYVYDCCLFLIFGQTTMAQEQKYLAIHSLAFSGVHVSVYKALLSGIYVLK